MCLWRKNLSVPVAEHPYPKLGAFIGAYRDVESLLVYFRRDTQHHMGLQAEDSSVLLNPVVDAVHELERVAACPGGHQSGAPHTGF